MAKQKRAKVALASATPDDDAALRDCLARLDDILSHAALFGGGEVVRADNLARRVRAKVTPEPNDRLIAEAQAFLLQFQNVVEDNRRRTEAREIAKAKERADNEAAVVARRAAEEAARLERRRGAIGG